MQRVWPSNFTARNLSSGYTQTSVQKYTYKDIYRRNSKKLKTKLPSWGLTQKLKAQYFIAVTENEVALFVLICKVLQDL